MKTLLAVITKMEPDTSKAVIGEQQQQIILEVTARGKLPSPGL